MSKRTNLTQLQALLASTIPSKILEIGTTSAYLNPKNVAAFVEVQAGAERRQPDNSPELLSHSRSGTKWRRAPKTGAPPEYLYPLPTLRQL